MVFFNLHRKWCTACIEETAGRIEVRYMATVMYIARSISLESLKVIAAKIAIIAVHHTHTTRQGGLHRIPEGKWTRILRFFLLLE